MTARYYVAIRPTTSDDHSIHKEGCPFMPEKGKRIYLGLFKTSGHAAEEGRHYFDKSEKCQFCCHDKNLKDEKTPEMDWSYRDFVPVKMQIPVSFVSGMMCCLS
jgi:hypothetical protein